MSQTKKLTLILLLGTLLTGGAKAEPLRLLMVGPPGAGKGTQAKRLSKHYKLAHISTGAMLRDHISRSTPLGLKAKRYVETGELVPDAIIVEMLEVTLRGQKKGYILDGFPRNLEQAVALDEILSGLGQELTAVVELSVPDDVVVERLLARGRDDDKETIIRRRLEIYAQETAPVLHHYAGHARVVKVDGVGTIEEVQNRIHRHFPEGK